MAPEEPEPPAAEDAVESPDVGTPELASPEAGSETPPDTLLALLSDETPLSVPDVAPDVSPLAVEAALVAPLVAEAALVAPLVEEAREPLTPEAPLPPDEPRDPLPPEEAREPDTTTPPELELPVLLSSSSSAPVVREQLEHPLTDAPSISCAPNSHGSSFDGLGSKVSSGRKLNAAFTRWVEPEAMKTGVPPVDVLQRTHATTGGNAPHRMTRHDK